MIPAWAYWPLLGLAVLLAAGVGFLTAYVLRHPDQGRHGRHWQIAGAGDGSMLEQLERYEPGVQEAARPFLEGGWTAEDVARAAGSTPGPDPVNSPEWCGRGWHDGECCAGSAGQYAAEPALFTAPPEMLEQIPGLPGPGDTAEAAALEGTAQLAGVLDLYGERIRRLDALSPRQLLDFAIYAAGWDGELTDRALEMLNAPRGRKRV